MVDCCESVDNKFRGCQYDHGTIDGQIGIYTVTAYSFLSFFIFFLDSSTKTAYSQNPWNDLEHGGY
jgi:hypothetical protein